MSIVKQYNMIKNPQIPDYHFKIIMIGEVEVGKSNLVSWFIQNKPCGDKSFLAYASKKMIIHEKLVSVGIWDTGGQEIYGTIAPVYYRDALGAFVVFDLSQVSSFERLKKWLSEIKERSERNIVMIMIGNKADLRQERVLSYEEAAYFAEKNSMLYLETSALDGNGVQSAFEMMLEMIFHNQLEVRENFEES